MVDIFNRVNSGGTKLSKGDLALAKICADWPEARDTMKAKLKEWAKADYHFNLDWLLRSVNTALTGEAKFQFLHDKTAEEIQDGLKRATKHIDTSLNLIGGRLGWTTTRSSSAASRVPVMVRYLDRRIGPARTQKERDKLLFWFVQAGMWGRFSGSTESFIDQDLAALEGEDGGLDKLLDQLRLWHGGLRVEPGHFTGWSLGARFYPVLYLLTRMGEARDWGTGLPLKASLLGKMSRLEVHHIFPKAQLYKHKFKRPEVNAPGELLLPHEGHEPQHQRPAARGVFPGGRGGPSRRAGLAVDSDRPGAAGRSRTTATSSKHARRCWRPRPTGGWRSFSTARHAGSKARPPRRRSAIAVSGRHHERGRGGSPRRAERLDRGAGIAPRRPGLRLRRRRERRAGGRVRSRLAERDSGGAEPAGGRPAQRDRGDPVRRQPGRFPVLHHRRGLSGLRATRVC